MNENINDIKSNLIDVTANTHDNVSQKTQQWGSQRQKMNYEAKNAQNLTKLTTHHLDPMTHPKSWFENFRVPTNSPLWSKLIICAGTECGRSFLVILGYF